MPLPQEYVFPGVVPKDALEFLKEKKLKPGFSYLDVWRQEHRAAFTVAKVMEKDILKDIQDSLERALEEGTTFQQWKKEIKTAFDKSGWTAYGTEKETPRRLKVIYQTNMRMARAIGQTERIQKSKKTHPYLEFYVGPSVKHRDEHLEWDGLVLPADDPWWDTHTGPMGYGCKCGRRQLSEDEAQELGIDEAPETLYEDWENPATGETLQVPEGVTPGFDYPKTSQARQQLLDRELEEDE